jgi:hypothetical protein
LKIWFSDRSISKSEKLKVDSRYRSSFDIVVHSLLKRRSNLVPLGYRFHLPLSNTVFIYGLSVIMKALNPHD